MKLAGLTPGARGDRLEPRERASTPREAVFRARGVSMGEVEVHALRSADLDLYRGELMVLLGASGSGKSTLLNILGGLDVPTAGTVWFQDHNLTEADDAGLTRYRRDHVGFVFQFYNLIPSLTARENVALVTEIARAPMRPEEALAWWGSASGWTTSRPSSPAASSSAWPSPAPSPSARTSCCATSPPARSTPRPDGSC
jgi:hypothetical protein